MQLSVVAGPDARVPISLSDDPAGFAAPLPERLDGLRVAWAPTLGGQVTVDPAVLATSNGHTGMDKILGSTSEGSEEVSSASGVRVWKGNAGVVLGGILCGWIVGWARRF